MIFSAKPGKKINRRSNEILFEQDGDILTPYQLSSGEKQMLVNFAYRTGTRQSAICTIYG